MRSNGTAAFHTLGCKLNFSETSTLAKQLMEAGYARVQLDESPDVVVINTCSVTDHADSKCRNAVRRALASNPNAFVAVVGCYAQLKPKEIASIPGVQVVLGAGEKFNLIQHIHAHRDDHRPTIHVGEIKEVRDFVPGYSSGDRTRTFLKVQDGCDYFCAFCTIPLARGRSRSATIEATLQQAQRAIKSGAREIVLTGVNIGDFGKAHGEKLIDLCKALDNLEDVDRFRISSIEPNLLEDDLIDFVASSRRFMPHFHIPLQSASDKILASMRRRYRVERYASRIDHIRNRLPMASIGVDVITGFPGEDDEAFGETLQRLVEWPVSYFHVFTYSERANTTALRIGDVVPIQVRQQRTQKLRALSLKKQRAHYEQFLEEDRQVLLENATDEGMRYGFTPEYVRVAVPVGQVEANHMVSVRLKKIHASGHMTGNLSPLISSGSA